MIKPDHRHHIITIPLGGIGGAFGMMGFLSVKADELTEKTEVAQACLDLIQTILSVFN